MPLLRSAHSGRLRGNLGSPRMWPTLRAQSRVGLGVLEPTTLRWRMGLSPHILPFQQKSRVREEAGLEGKMATWDYGFHFGF